MEKRDSIRADLVLVRFVGNTGMGESHEHGRTTCAYGGVDGVSLCFIAHSSASGMSSAYVSSSASSRIQFFPVVLDVRHLLRIMVLIQYTSGWENLMSIGESHGNGRTPMRI